jgi:hypothetical protein
MSLIAALATVGTTISLGALSGTAAAVLGGVAVGGTAGAGIGAIKAAASGEDVGKGALMGGVGGAVTGGIAPGLGSAVAAPLTSAIGSTATGAVVGGVAGAAGGAAGSAAGGEDAGKGALMGGATGAVAGGTMGAIGPAPSGELATAANGTAVSADPIGTAPIGTAGETVGTGVTSVQPSGALGSLAQSATDAGLPVTGDQLSTGLTGLAGVAGTDYAGNSIIDAQDAAKKAAEEDKARGLDFASQGNAGLAAVSGAGLPTGSGPLGSLGKIGRATGGLTALAHGGQIPLKDGAYIIPADVVSALGNGSSKAGAEFLRHLMMEVRKEAVNIQGLGAAKNHVA